LAGRIRADPAAADKPKCVGIDSGYPQKAEKFVISNANILSR
jgi:hypothetical protein